jgi:hypothetical protein
MPTPTWTTADQQALEALQARKAEFEAQHKEPLIRYMVNLTSSLYLGPSKAAEDHGRRIADWMISDADTIRDLLKPFDSGVRPANAEEKA